MMAIKLLFGPNIQDFVIPIFGYFNTLAPGRGGVDIDVRTRNKILSFHSQGTIKSWQFDDGVGSKLSGNRQRKTSRYNQWMKAS